MFISLVRHGATEQNQAHILEGHSDTPLSALGERQSQLAADHLANRPIDTMYSSCARRAIETATIIATRLEIDFVTDERLNERDYGEFEGLCRSELLKRRSDLGLSNVDPTQDWCGIESVESDADIWNRIRTFFEDGAAKHIAIVTHNGVIRAALHTAFRIPVWQSRCFQISNGSVSTLRIISGSLELIELWQPSLFSL